MGDLLLVEDDHTLGMSLQLSLTSQGHDVRWCRSIRAARKALSQHSVDLILLDLGLPDGDGMDLCRELRKEQDLVPILMLTARGTLESRIEGLDSGADDYVPKPFELSELLARVEALLRRQQWHRPADQVLIGRLRVDFRLHESWIGDEPVLLTDLELRLLKHLLLRVGEPVTREELLEEVWGVSRETRTRTVDVFISRLRRDVEVDSGDPRHLLNVRGVGYRLVLKPPK